MKKWFFSIALAAGSVSLFGQYAWNSVGSGTNLGVQSLASDINNQALYAGGFFTIAGGAPALNVARWNGSAYAPLGSGILNGNGINCLLVMPNGDLIAGGSFTDIGGIITKNIAQWNGLSWSSIGPGLDGSAALVKCLAVYNNELYAGGIFSNSGGTPVNNIAKWDGTNWVPVGGGINGTVSALCVYNGELYAGGTFTNAGGVAVNNVAKWNGNAWADVGGGCSYTGTISVSTFQVYSGGLYAGGTFTTAGTTAVKHIAQWDGTSWHDVGGGAEGYTGTISVSTIQVFKNDLVVGGTFDSLGTAQARYIGKWNGVAWSSLGTGMNNTVSALAVLADTLYAGGWFTQAGPANTMFIAQWQPNYVFATSLKGVHKDPFSIYPNPAADHVVIENSTSPDRFSLVISDALGRTLRKIEGAGHRLAFSRDDLPAGVYFYKIKGSDAQVMQEGRIIFAD